MDPFLTPIAIAIAKTFLTEVGRRLSTRAAASAEQAVVDMTQAFVYVDTDANIYAGTWTNVFPGWADGRKTTIAGYPWAGVGLRGAPEYIDVTIAQEGNTDRVPAVAHRFHKSTIKDMWVVTG